MRLRVPCSKSNAWLIVTVLIWSTTVSIAKANVETDCCEDALLCDIPYTGTIGDPLETDAISFSVADGEICSFTVEEGSPSSPDFSPIWRIVRGDGSQMYPWTGSSPLDRGPFAASGNPYRVEVRDNDSDGTGAYSVTISGCVLVGVDVDMPAIRAFALYQNAPNPFNLGTMIRYYLPEPSRVTLRVYDVSGRLVITLRHGVIENAGCREVTWNGTGDTGRRVAPSTYFYRLTAGGYSRTKRMVLVE